jgi:hypothetical protein
MIRLLFYTVVVFVVAVTSVILSVVSANAATITNDGITILYEGEVVQSDVARMEEMLDNTGIKTVFLNSPGGNAMTGYQLGYLFHEKEVNLIVGQDASCFSACAIAFLGGEERTKLGLLGFHVAWTTNTESMSEGMKQGQVYGTITAAYFFRMGYSLQLPYMISMYTDKDTFLMLDVKDLNMFKLESMQDFIELKDLPPLWAANRIAGPTRRELMIRGM